jgi:hypothetical protein
MQKNIAAVIGPDGRHTPKDLVRFDVPSMAEAAACAAWRKKFFAEKTGANAARNDYMGRAAVSGDARRLASAMAVSDTLLDEAIAYDARLARRPSWQRGEDGIFADAGLVASGDDSPCFDMRRSGVVDYAAETDPVRVVICTDSQSITADSCAAFVATVRIVQQFRPVLVWWQGSWLADCGTEIGFVFHVPLISNDMDFSRVEYVINDRSRDGLSFAVAARRAITHEKTWLNGCGRHAERSYLPGGSQFVGKDGVSPSGRAIANTAAAWLGWETSWWVSAQAKEDGAAALQSLPAESDTRVYTPPTEAERRSWDEHRERIAAEAARKAQDRLASAGCTE